MASDGEREPVFVNPILTIDPSTSTLPVAHHCVAQCTLHFESQHDVILARAPQTFWVQTAPTQRCAKHPRGSGAVRSFHRRISRSRRAPHSLLGRRAQDPHIRVAALLGSRRRAAALPGHCTLKPSAQSRRFVTAASGSVQLVAAPAQSAKRT